MWILFIFWSNKIHISPTSIVSSLSPPQCRLSSSRRRHTTTSCHCSFLLSQDELAASASSFDNVLSHHLPSQTETKVLNLHHRRRLPSLDRSTPTLYCYKKISSNLATLSTTQPRLHFAFSLTKLKHHVIGALSTTVIPFYRYLILIVPCISARQDTYWYRLS
jgi:hypothetical protein